MTCLAATLVEGRIPTARTFVLTSCGEMSQVTKQPSQADSVLRSPQQMLYLFAGKSPSLPRSAMSWRTTCRRQCQLSGADGRRESWSRDQNTAYGRWCSWICVSILAESLKRAIGDPWGCPWEDPMTTTGIAISA